MAKREFQGPIDARRFWESVDRRGDNECWPWKGSCYTDGSGIFRYFPAAGSRATRASRMAYLLANGPLKHLACHTCDNPVCCNPHHLYDGTHKDNTRDMHVRGRYKHQGAHGDRNIARKHPEKFQGERNGRAKLTVAQVQQIREMYATEHVSQTQLAKHFGVHQTMIGFIVRREFWKCVA